MARVTASADLVTVETWKGERFYFTHDVVAGLKVAQPEGKGIGRGAGPDGRVSARARLARGRLAPGGCGTEMAP